MSITGLNRRKLSEQEQSWANNLSRIYKEKKSELGINQDTLASRMGWDSQGSVGQYMTGRIALNTDAKIAFSKALQVQITDIDPDFDVSFLMTREMCLKAIVDQFQKDETSLNKQELDLIEKYRKLKSADKAAVEKLINALI